MLHVICNKPHSIYKRQDMVCYAVNFGPLFEYSGDGNWASGLLLGQKTFQCCQPAATTTHTLLPPTLAPTSPLPPSYLTSSLIRSLIRSLPTHMPSQLCATTKFLNFIYSTQVKTVPVSSTKSIKLVNWTFPMSIQSIQACA